MSSAGNLSLTISSSRQGKIVCLLPGLEQSMLGICNNNNSTIIKMHTCAAGQSAYTVTFSRAGEDNKSFRLGDIDQTLQGETSSVLLLLQKQNLSW